MAEVVQHVVTESEISRELSDFASEIIEYLSKIDLKWGQIFKKYKEYTHKKQIRDFLSALKQQKLAQLE